MARIRVWAGGRGVVWEAEGGLRLPLRDRQQQCVSSKWHKQPQSTGQAETVNWLQFGTTQILINAIQWLHRPCGARS